MKYISYSLHRFFTPFVPSSFITILWDREQLRQALKVGPTHPKYLRARNLVDKIKAKEVTLKRRQTALDLGFFEPVEGGWGLTHAGEDFCRKQMALAQHGNPCQKAQWETIERCMLTLMDRSFDVLFYHPKKQSEASRLFAYLYQETDIDKLVEAAVKVLTNDQDQVDSEEQEENDSPLDEEPLYTTENEDDEDLSDTENELVIGEDSSAPLLDRIMDEYIHMKEEGACGCTPDSKLWKLLMEVVELKTEFGSEKDYFNLPDVGEFDLSKPDKENKADVERYEAELAAYRAYRLDSLREGYSDAPNYEFLDLDIPSYEEERVVSVSKEHFSEEFKQQLKEAYKNKLEELKGLDSPDKTMRDAYLTVVHTLGEGKFEEVGQALAS